MAATCMAASNATSATQLKLAETDPAIMYQRWVTQA